MKERRVREEEKNWRSIVIYDDLLSILKRDSAVGNPLLDTRLMKILISTIKEESAVITRNESKRLLS